MLTNKCPHCGSYNDEGMAECYFCHQVLPGAKKGHKPKPAPENITFKSAAQPKNPLGEKPRPMGLSILAVISYAIGFYSILSTFCKISSADPNLMAAVHTSQYAFFLYLTINFFSFFHAMLGEITSQSYLGAMLILLVVAAAGLIIGWGLWNQKRWMRFILMVLQVMGVLVVLFSADNPILGILKSMITPGGGDIAYILRVCIVIGIVLSYAGFFLWLAFNGKRFKH